MPVGVQRSGVVGVGGAGLVAAAPGASAGGVGVGRRAGSGSGVAGATTDALPRMGFRAANFAASGVRQSSFTRPPVSPLLGL